MKSEKTDAIRFDGQVAIVTGAGGGLGRTHALQLAERGARLIMNDLGVARGGSGRNSAAAETVAQEIRDAGGIARVSHGSVTDEAAVKDMVALAMSEWGRVDILVNNAGFFVEFHAILTRLHGTQQQAVRTLGRMPQQAREVERSHACLRALR